MKSLSIYLFRNDLRLLDNHVLQRAAKSDFLIPLYVLDPQFYLEAKTWEYKFPRNSNLKFNFLLQSLIDLQLSLRSKGSELLVLKGNTSTVVNELISSLKADYKLIFYLQHEPAYEEQRIEDKIKSICKNTSPTVDFHSIWSRTLVSQEIVTKVPHHFTQFRKMVESNWKIPDLVDCPRLPPTIKNLPKSIDLSLFLTSDTVDSNSVLNGYKGGESEGQKRISDYFFKFDCLKSYKDTRNGLIGSNYSSKFSPYLAFGCISPRYIYYKVKEYEEKIKNDSTYWLIFELLWRDFFRFIAVDFKHHLFTINGPYNNKREWKSDKTLFLKWANGETGIPFIDANMRELKATGYMSNRGRQNVASFLTKDLNLDWRLGAEWFEQHLIDHDVYSNYGNWLYASGVALDPRENRKFNIIKQSKQYDPNGDYLRMWLNLKNDVDHIHHPWTDDKYSSVKPVVIAPEWEKFIKLEKVKNKGFKIQ